MGSLSNDAVQVKNFFRNKLIINNIKITDAKQEKQLNAEVFSHCLSMAEKDNITFKADKMLVISEMSRSLFWGFITIICLNLYMILKHSLYYKFYYFETFCLVILSIIFLHRKVRYEKYRFHILIRTFLLHIKLGQDKKSR